MKIFDKYKLGPTELKNRLVMPPMCMYQVENNNGIANSFHKSHYTARAIGQVGLIIVESTGVMPNARITDNCLGLWNDDQIDGLKEIVDNVHREGSKVFIQLNHAGRKSETSGLKHVGPSAIAFNDQELNYEQASSDEIDEIISAFKEAAIRADKAGFDGIEIHSAHGYLIHQFISPISNKRDDEYGQDKFLLLKKVTEAVRSVWPKEKGLIVRISATDYLEEGLKIEEWIRFFVENPNLFDAIHVSSGGLVNAPINAYPGYMLEFSRRIRETTSYPTIGVGLLNNGDIANMAIENGNCDLVACGRELLRNPNFLLNIAHERSRDDLIPKSYLRAY